MPRVQTAFSRNYFVSTTQNNRIKVWRIDDTFENKSSKNALAPLLIECSEANHLKIKYTALGIYDSDKSDVNESLIALGDRVGRIVVFNVGTGAKVLEISQSENARPNGSGANQSAAAVIHIRGGHTSRVNGLYFYKSDNNQICLLSVANDKTLCQWNIRGDLLRTFNIGDNVPSSLLWLQRQYCAVASNDITVWDTTHKIPIAYYTGHASQIRHLKSTPDSNYIVTGAQDRFLYLWKLKSLWKNLKKMNKKKDDKKVIKKLLQSQSATATNGDGSADLKRHKSLHTLALDDDVLSIDIRQIAISHSDKKSSNIVYYIAAASKSAVYIWRFDPDSTKQSKKDTKQSGKSNKSDAIKTLQPICKVLAHNPISSANNSGAVPDLRYSWIRKVIFTSDRHLLIARGDANIPIMKSVEFAHDSVSASDGNKHFLSEIVLDRVSITEKEEKQLLKSDNATTAFEIQAEAIEDEHMTVLDVGDAAMPMPTTAAQVLASKSVDSDAEEAKEDKPTSSPKLSGKKRSRSTMDEEQSASSNTAMGPPKQKKRKKQSKTSEARTFGEQLAELEESQSASSKSAIPTADSLAALLTQSLAANDQKMFENLLSIQNESREFEADFIRNTLDKIETKTAVTLLKRLTDKFRSRPRDSISLLRWLVPLLNRHAGVFSKSLDTRRDLVSIHQTIDYHVQTLMPAFKLQGRLSLLTDQIDKVKQYNTSNNDTQSNRNTGLDIVRHKPLFVHFDNMEQSNKKSNHTNKNTDDADDTMDNDNGNDNDNGEEEKSSEGDNESILADMIQV